MHEVIDTNVIGIVSRINGFLSCLTYNGSGYKYI